MKVLGSTLKKKESTWNRQPEAIGRASHGVCRAPPPLRGGTASAVVVLLPDSGADGREPRTPSQPRCSVLLARMHGC